MKHSRLVLPTLLAALVLAACGTSPMDSEGTSDTSLRTAAVSSATIDFEEGLVGGDYLLDDGEVAASKFQVGVDGGVPTGVTFTAGDPVEGPIYVRGERNPDAWEGNFARIFDATCGGGTEDDCTGDDPDLFAPGQGNILIVQEGPGLPDDAIGERFTIDFSDFGPAGSVDVHSFFYIDVEDYEEEEGLPKVEFYDADGGVLEESIAITADGVSDVWPTDPAVETPIMGVRTIVVTFAGSGGIDDFVIDVPQEREPSEGCTPGYWRNHAGFGPQPNTWVGFDPATAAFSDADAFDREITIRGRELGEDGLERGGRPQDILDPLLFESAWAIGGDVNALARHAVAALLNASHPDVDYPYSVEQVQEMVQDAIDGSEDMGHIQNLLVIANEADCPL